MKKVIVILSIIMIGFTMNYCKKDPPNPPTPYHIRLTDATGPYNAVYIDLRAVEIIGNDGKAIMMNIDTGIINLLNFSNGLDTLIATGSLVASSVQQIRLILGPNNTVMVDSVIYPLITPSAEQSGLKLQVNQTLQPGVQYTVLLDFDVNKSIVLEGNGTYKLKPVIRTIEAALGGSIKGKITPVGTIASVTATSTISYSSNVNANGDFMLLGLPPGTYSITVNPASPLNPVTQNNITVTIGVSTDIGTITL